jgi:hypothetical protein
MSSHASGAATNAGTNTKAAQADHAVRHMGFAGCGCAYCASRCSSGAVVVCTPPGIASCRAAGRLVDALGALDAHSRTREHNRQPLGFRPREAHDVAAPVDAVPGPDAALGVSDDAAHAIHPIVATIGPMSLGD